MTTPPEHAAIRLAILEPTAIDPYRAQERMGLPITKALFDGLLRLDREGRVRGNVADEWSHSPDGRTWTFRLRDDSRFSNGEAVTAAHFVHGWNRAVDQAGRSETTYHLAGISGYAERTYGCLDVSSSENGSVLTVRLSQPDYEFDKKTLQPIFSPVCLDSGPATDPQHQAQPVANGPFRLAEPWLRGESEWIELVRNEHYQGPRPAQVERISLAILEPDTATTVGAAGLRAGHFHIGYPPPTEEPGDRTRFAEVAVNLAGVEYLLPFLHHGVLADPAVRFAVNHAIDRTALLRERFGSVDSLATSMVPPAMGSAHREVPLRTAYDPELARKYLQAASLAEDAVLTIVYNIEGNHEGWLGSLRDQVQTNLGLAVELIAKTAWEVVEYRTSEAAQGACRAGWVADYPTADNVLFPLLHSSCTNADENGQAHGDNEGRYANPEFDELIRQARAEPDADRRNRLYAEAEELAIGQDLAIIPLWYITESRWYDPRAVSDVRIDAFGCLVLDELQRVSEAPA